MACSSDDGQQQNFPDLKMLEWNLAKIIGWHWLFDGGDVVLHMDRFSCISSCDKWTQIKGEVENKQARFSRIRWLQFRNYAENNQAHFTKAQRKPLNRQDEREKES